MKNDRLFFLKNDKEMKTIIENDEKMIVYFSN